MKDFKKNLIILISVFLFVVAGLGLLFYYFRNDIAQSVVSINTYRQELAARAMILDSIQSLEQQFAASQQYAKRLEAALPTEAEMVSLEEVLQNLSQQDDLDLSFRFGVLNEKTDQEPKSYSFNLVLKGKIDGILRWMEGLQELDYIIRLEQIEWNQVGIIGGDSYYNVKILGRVYIR